MSPEMPFKLNMNDVSNLILETKNRLFSQPTILDVKCKNALIIGDLHGDFESFIKILTIWREQGYEKIIFLGDIVDRGTHALEILYFILKLIKKNWSQITFIRGNHETEDICSYYGFREELRSKRKEELFDVIIDFFDVLPYGGILNNRFFLVHGGIPKQKQSEYPLNAEEIRKIPKLSGDRFILSQLLWNDPIDKEVFFENNYYRGVGYFYGKKAIRMFLEESNLEKIIRAHEAVSSGVKEIAEGKVITVFSNNEYYFMVSPKILIYENEELIPLELSKINPNYDLVRSLIE